MELAARPGYARVIPTYEVILDDSPTGPGDGSTIWRRTIEADSRAKAVRTAEDLFRSETGRHPLYVGPVKEIKNAIRPPRSASM